jgi:hypothetical protein
VLDKCIIIIEIKIKDLQLNRLNIIKMTIFNITHFTHNLNNDFSLWTVHNIQKIYLSKIDWKMSSFPFYFFFLLSQLCNEQSPQHTLHDTQTFLSCVVHVTIFTFLFSQSVSLGIIAVSSNTFSDTKTKAPTSFHWCYKRYAFLCKNGIYFSIN